MNTTKSPSRNRRERAGGKADGRGIRAVFQARPTLTAARAAGFEMVAKLSLACSLLALGAVLHAAPVHAAPGARVRHLPPAEAAPGVPLRLTVLIDRAWETTLEVRFRTVGQNPGSASDAASGPDNGAWQSAQFTRQDADRYIATVPAEAVAPPGIEYYIAAADDSTAVYFASAAAPHRINVFRDPKDIRRMAYLARHDNRRAQVRVASEYVDYGSRVIGGKSLPDSYLRIDADVGYRVLSFPLESLRFGYTYLLGRTPLSPRGDDSTCMPQDSVEDCTQEAGFKVGGWFELRFILRDGWEVDTRGMVMATPLGFNVGGRAELRIGESLGSHVALGTERIADVGAAGYFRLAWGTVPGFPMAATVEVTSFPATNRDLAVRLIYDLARSLPNGVRIGGRLGYQARDQLVGGINLGLNASLDF